MYSDAPGGAYLVLIGWNLHAAEIEVFRTMGIFAYSLPPMHFGLLHNLNIDLYEGCH